MKEYWVYMCDFSHQWILLKDQSDEENDQEAMCPFGHEAVIRQKRKMLNPVQFSLRSAYQIVDAVKDQKALKNDYYVVVTNLDRGIEQISSYPYSFEDAILMLRKLIGLTYEKVIEKLRE